MSATSPDPAQDISRRHRLGASEFPRDFFGPSRPVLVTGWLDGWAAMGKWTPEFFRDAHGDQVVGVEVVGANDTPELYCRGRPLEQMTLRELYSKVMSPAEGGPLHYLSRWKPVDAVPELAADVGSLGDYNRVAGMPRWVTRRLTNGPVLWMGPKGSHTPIHIDLAPNLIVQLYGRKRWTVWAPEENANLYYPHWPFFRDLEKEGEFPFMSPVHFERPDPARFPRFAKARSFTFEVGPGDVLFLPPRWWHHVQSLDPSISINYWRPNAFTAKVIGIYKALVLRAALRRRFRGLVHG